MKKFKLWQNAWKDNPEESVTISLPEAWDVEYHGMQKLCWKSCTWQGYPGIIFALSVQQAHMEP